MDEANDRIHVPEEERGTSESLKYPLLGKGRVRQPMAEDSTCQPSTTWEALTRCGAHHGPNPASIPPLPRCNGGTYTRAPPALSRRGIEVGLILAPSGLRPERFTVPLVSWHELDFIVTSL